MLPLTEALENQAQSFRLFTKGELVSTQVILQGFGDAVDELLP